MTPYERLARHPAPVQCPGEHGPACLYQSAIRAASAHTRTDRSDPVRIHPGQCPGRATGRSAVVEPVRRS
ncbi:hypothetical protein RZS08_57360, partial [Arthrospira platensis SPKY1]|nr:hypothetical protein [Arthrospira platensis SPKY1]